MRLKLLEYLKNNATGKENAVKGNVLEAIFDLTPSKVRGHIKDLRMDQDLIIGATNKGYYIPREEEHLEAVRYAENKTISHLETTIKQRPSFILRVYKRLNELKENLPEAVHKQLKFDDDYGIIVVDKYNEKLPFE